MLGLQSLLFWLLMVAICLGSLMWRKRASDVGSLATLQLSQQQGLRWVRALERARARGAYRFLARSAVRAELARRSAGVLSQVSARLADAMGEGEQAASQLVNWLLRTPG